MLAGPGNACWRGAACLLVEGRRDPTGGGAAWCRGSAGCGVWRGGGRQWEEERREAAAGVKSYRDVVEGRLAEGACNILEGLGLGDGQFGACGGRGRAREDESERNQCVRDGDLDEGERTKEKIWRRRAMESGGGGGG